jgi:hypothetical protein
MDISYQLMSPDARSEQTGSFHPIDISSTGTNVFPLKMTLFLDYP